MTEESNENKKSQSDSNTDDSTNEQESDDTQFQNKNDDKIAELMQEKIILKSINKTLLKKLNTKNYLIITLAIITLASFFTGSYFFLNVDESKKYRIYNNIPTSQFVIQNLKGDIIDTWIAWKILEVDLFHVHVIDSKYRTQERIDAIIETIMSTEEIKIDDSLLHKGPEGSTSTYYVGWFGALNRIDENTESPIPKNLHFHVTDKGEGDILIKLSNLSSPDGYSGFTKAIVDEEEHQILKSTITIYNIESLSIEQLKTILRHELGHGFGLAHSSAPEDLMAPTITTEYPYISECDLDAITMLYDGGESSQVICEK